tara:strand:- start:4321 stop:5403 length:1083 start_codon:yes stop_codon:yes gene_type:complete
MKVNGKNLTTIWYNQNYDFVEIIDQTLLPHELKIIKLKSLNNVIFAIKNMLVRGAPLIGVAASYGMYFASKKDSNINNLLKSSKLLLNTRPTAVNLKWAIDKIISKIKNIDKHKRSELILKIANDIRNNDIISCSKIGDNGLKLLEKIYNKKKSRINILTHCNAGWLATVDWGTALSPIFKANRKKIPIHVWVDETRPRNQGFNLTSWELMNENIPNSLIVDNVGGHLMQKGKVDLCITGTDRTTLNGDVCNKIGTYLKALAAYDNNIPFFVAAPISSIDFSIIDGLKSIPIEERNSNEVSMIDGINKKGKREKIMIVPKNSKCKNYAFDVTPAKFISKIITDKKVVLANKKSILSLIKK